MNENLYEKLDTSDNIPEIKNTSDPEDFTDAISETQAAEEVELLQDIYSDSNNDQDDTTTSHQSSTNYSYKDYCDQFKTPSTLETKKKKPKQRQTAMIICGLILATCLGFGGGVLGSALMPHNESTFTVSEQSNMTAKTDKKSDTSLNVIETAKTNKGTNSVQTVVEKVKDSVVEITTESTSYNSFYGQYVTQGAGSGVIITSDGYILTNNHVVENSAQIKVKLTDGTSYDAKVIGTDEDLDVALIKIDAKDLTVATLGKSSDLEVGEMSVVIGNPLGNLGGSVTAGIISALNRNITIDGKTMELLQTDAAINPGNSGGGLFDANGDLVGIVVAKSTQSGSTTIENIGYAIPIDNVKAILENLKNGTTRPIIGVTLVDVLTDDTAKRYGVDQQGVYVASVTKGGSAEQAGIVVGDLIKKIDDVEITKLTDVTKYLAQKKANDTVKIVVYRDGKEETITVTLQEKTTNHSKKNSNNFKSGNNGSYSFDDDFDYNNDPFEDIYKYYFN